MGTFRHLAWGWVAFACVVLWAVRSHAEEVVVEFTDGIARVGSYPADSIRRLLASDTFAHGVSLIERDVSRRVSLAPNDPLANPPLRNQWAIFGAPLAGTRGDVAWETTTGDERVVVAIIDTGVLSSHPDLRENIWRNPGETPNNGVDDDGNGYVDDVSGWDFIDDDGIPQDDLILGDVAGHGTHVAGIVGARGDNGIGIAGMNWKVSLLPLKVLNAKGVGRVSHIAKAIYYAIDLRIRRGVDLRLINLSLGSDKPSEIERRAIQSAIEAGIIVVAAAGNESRNGDIAPSYPAGYSLPGLVGVAAIERDGTLADYSNYGRQSVHIAAPGSEILSTVPQVKRAGGTYRYSSGTSMATPHATGALALMMAANPSLSGIVQVDTLLAKSLSLAPLSDRVRSGGTVDAGASVVTAALLPRGVTLRGEVVSQFGPVHGAEVRSGFGVTATNTLGVFEFRGIPEGSNFVVSVQRPGYRSTEEDPVGTLHSDTSLRVRLIAPQFQIRTRIRGVTRSGDRVRATLRRIDDRRGEVGTFSLRRGSSSLGGYPEGSYRLTLRSSTLSMRPRSRAFALRGRDLSVAFAVSRRR